jgi:hypothetical protein
MVEEPLAVPAEAEAGRNSAPRLVRRVSAGCRGSERACSAGRRWFQDLQADNGSFPATDARDTPAVTALVMLALARAGHSHRHGKYKDYVKKGLLYLKERSQHDPDQPGLVAPVSADGRHRYNQAIATLAMVEQYDLTRSPALKVVVQRFVTRLLAMQSPRGGWPLAGGAGQDDTALTIWAALALKAAQLAELEGVEQPLDAAVRSLEAVTDAGGRATWASDNVLGARPAGVRWAPSLETLRAGVLAVRLITGRLTRDDVTAQTVADTLLAQPPHWNPKGGNDVIRWWWGTIALFHMDPERWKAWNRPIKEALVKTQRRGGKFDGMWDPALIVSDPSSGEIGDTCLAIQSLTIYYRYDRAAFRHRRGGRAKK